MQSNMIFLDFIQIPKLEVDFIPKLSKEQIIFPPRLLNNETKATIDKISKADGNHTIAANVVFHTTGVILSRNNIHYLSGSCNELENVDGVIRKDSTEKMKNYLKKKEFNHMVLYHDGCHNQLMNVCQDKSNKQWINLPPKEDDDLQQFLNVHSQVFGVERHQALFIGLAQVTPMEQKFFEYFPEVICVYAVTYTAVGLAKYGQLIAK